MIFLVDKPAGMTSHSVVAKIKYALKNFEKDPKVGHSGTLDPMCTGLLPVFTGKDTKLISILPHGKKYRAGMLLGRETDTEDVTGTTLCERKVTASKEEVFAAAKSLHPACKTAYAAKTASQNRKNIRCQKGCSACSRPDNRNAAAAKVIHSCRRSARLRCRPLFPGKAIPVMTGISSQPRTGIAPPQKCQPDNTPAASSATCARAPAAAASAALANRTPVPTILAVSSTTHRFSTHSVRNCTSK